MLSGQAGLCTIFIIYNIFAINRSIFLLRVQTNQVIILQRLATIDLSLREGFQALSQSTVV